jgi:hypothetical protein
LGNWRGGEPVRVHFGPAINFDEFYDRRDSVRTYKEIADFVMSKIAELGEQDAAERALEAKLDAVGPTTTTTGTIANQKSKI